MRFRVQYDVILYLNRHIIMSRVAQELINNDVFEAKEKIETVR